MNGVESTDQSNKSNQSISQSTLPPPLKFKINSWIRPSLYLVFLIVCNVLIPCLLYYLLKSYTKLGKHEQTLIGIGSAALGISSCFDAPFRLYRLIRYRNKFGPLNSNVWWHLDFTMWLYTIALFFFAIPLAIAPAIPLYDFFLFSTALLVAPVGIVFFISLYSFSNLPFYLSSDLPKTLSKPALYYILEDVVAVDFEHGREWRRSLKERYDSSPPFRSMIYYLTLYWAFAALVYVGITSVVTWASPLHFAFGWVLGQFFLWAIASGFICYFLTKKGLAREKKWWENENIYSINDREEQEM